MRFLKHLSFHSVIISLILQSIVQGMVFTVPNVYAQEAVPDITLPAASDIKVYEKQIIDTNKYGTGNADVMDIVKANNGLSHNKLDDFNAVQKHKVLNNGFGAVGSDSKIVGHVDGNQNFEYESDRATKILFEVRNSSTRLEKIIEISGQKADFILANSKGIMCNGCGFINTSAVSFVTGSVSNASNPNNIEYNVSTNRDSRILIGSKGITFYGSNNEPVDFNLISRAIRIAGEIKTDNAKLNNFKIRAGAGKFYSGINPEPNSNSDPGFFEHNYQNLDTNNIVDAGDADGGSSNKGFAVVIDSTALGGVHPDQISIIATEEGAGVKNDANLISDLGSVYIEANGDISNSGKISGGTTSLSAKNIANNSGATIQSTSGGLTLTAINGNILNYGSLISAAIAELKASSSINNSGTISGTNLKLDAFNINNSGSLTASSNVNLTASNDITNSGTISGSSLSLTATNNITNKNNGVIQSSDISLTATNGKVLNDLGGNIQSNSGQNLNLNLNNSDLENKGIIQALNTTLNITNLDNLTNSGTISGGVTSLTAKNITNNSGATIRSTSGDLTLTATDGNIVNYGSLISAAIAELTASNDITNSGTISGSSLSLTATNNITNNNNGVIQSSDISLTATNGKVLNDLGGEIQSNSGQNLNLNLNNSDLENKGKIQALNATLNITNLDNLTNSGTILGGTTSLSAKNITNNLGGTIQSTSGDLTLTATNNIANSGTIQSTSGDLTLNLDGTLTNEGNITSAAKLILVGNSTFTNEGNSIFSAATAYEITAKKFINKRDLDLQGGSIKVSDNSLQGLINTATITSSGNSDLAITGYVLNKGSFLTDNQLIISGTFINEGIIDRVDDTKSDDLSNPKSLKIKIKSGTLDNRGEIITANYLKIDGLDDANKISGSLKNSGMIRSDHLSDVNNSEDDDAIHIKDINLLQNSGVIDSAEDLKITAGEIKNENSGLLFATNDVILNTDKLTNDGENGGANIIASSGDIKIQKGSDGAGGSVKSDEVNNINGGQIKTLKSKIDAPLFDDADVRKVLEQYAIEMLSTSKFSAEELTRRLYALRGYLKNSDLSIEEQMNQGVSGNIKIHANTLKNDLKSVISSNNYIKINATNIINDRGAVLASANYFDIITNNLQNQNDAQIFGATVLNIKSSDAGNVGDLTSQILNSGLIRGGAVYLNSASIINNASNQAGIDLFGREFVSDDYYGVVFNDLFITNGSGNYLISINQNIADATDNTKLLDDFFNKINPNSLPLNPYSLLLNSKLLGDDIYLSNLIANLLQEKTKSRYLTFDATSDSAQLASFLNSTASQMQKLGIGFGSNLTEEQRSNLTDPFIAFKKQDVFVKDGQIFNTQAEADAAGAVGSITTGEEVYIPIVITPNATTINQETSNIASRNASAIEARNELVMSAAKEVTNRSDMKAGTIVIETADFINELDTQTLALDANGNLTYIASASGKAPTIEAKDNVIITAKNNFINNSANIIAGNNLVIDAKNDFNVNGRSGLGGGLKSNFKAGNIMINAANANVNHLNLASNNLSLDISNNLNLQNSDIASDNIYLSDLKGFAKINQSNINTNSGLNINAGGNVDILSSNIKAGGLQISSGNDLVIGSSKIDSSYLVTNSVKDTKIDNSNINSSDTIITAKNNFDLKNSNLSANNLVIDSGGDVGIDQSNIDTGSYLQINAKNNLNLNDNNISSGSVASFSSGKNTNLIGNNIAAVDLLQIAAGGDLNITTRQKTTHNSSFNGVRGRSQSVHSTTITHSGFNSLDAGNIALSSGGNTNIIGANLNADDAIQINSKGALTIASAKDTTTNQIQTTTQTRRGGFFGKRIISATSAQTTQTTNSEKTSNLNAGNIYLNSEGSLSVTGAKINTGDLIATAQGQITFKQNKSRTTGTLALVNDQKMVSSLMASKASDNSNNSQVPTNNSELTNNSSLTTYNLPLTTNANLPLTTNANLPLTTNANIVYEAGQVESSLNDLVLATNADIINHGSLIAGGNINLSATNITNSKVATVNYSGQSFNTTLSGEALIQAGGSVFMKATNDINNYAGTIIAGSGDITMLAGGNVNIGSIELKSRTVTSGGRKKRAWTSVSESTTNVGSNISAGNNLIIKAGSDAVAQGNNALGNINITGSNLVAGTNAASAGTNGGNIIMNASNNINIKSSVDSAQAYGSARKSSYYRSSTTNNKSNLVAGANSSNGGIYINKLNIDETSGTVSVPTSLADKDISNNVNIIGSNLTSRDNIAINAGGNITIASAEDSYHSIDRFKSKKRSSSIEVQKTTQVTSDLVANNGAIELNSGVDTNIIASNLIAADNINLASQGATNIISAEDRDYKLSTSKKKGSFSKKSSSSELDIRTQVASNIMAGGNVNIDSINDINIKASNLVGDNGSIISQIGNINIVNGIDSVKSFTSSKKNGMLSKSKDQVYDYQEFAAASNLNFNNNLSFAAEFGDLNIQSSNLNIGNDLNLGTFTIAKNADGSLKTKPEGTQGAGTFETVSGDSIKNINITSAELKSEHWEVHKSSSINPIAVVKMVANQAVNMVQKVAGNVIEVIPGGKKITNLADKHIDKFQDKANKEFDKQARNVGMSNATGKGDTGLINSMTSKISSSSITQSSSNINVGGNLMMNTAEDATIKASNLNIKGNALINTGGDLLITSAVENYNSASKNKEIVIGEVDIGFRDQSFKAGVKGSGTQNKYGEENVIQKSSNINIGGTLLANVQNDATILASNVAVGTGSSGGDAIIKTAGNFNLSDAHNTQNTNEENSKLEIEVGVKLGNAYVDTAYAAKALYDATKALADAKKKLDKMKNLKAEGRASQKAVDLAYTQVALATAGVFTANMNLKNSAQNSAQAAETSVGTGFYVAGYADTTYHTDFTQTNSSQSVGSTLTAGNNIAINAAKNFNQTGSLLASQNGDITISAITANIKAGESTFESTSGSKTVNASASIGNNGLGLSAGYNQSDNFILSNTFTNSQISATNGTFKLTTTGDTNLIGGNIIADKVALNIGGNLNLETLQDTYESNGSSFGINISGGIRGKDGSAIGNARNAISNFEQNTLGGGVNNPNNAQGQQNATPNFGVSVGMNETFIKKTAKASGIIELSTNDSTKTEAENLTNLLNTNSGTGTGTGSGTGTINIAGTITNNTQKEDINFTNADFSGYLDTNTISNTINSAKWLGNLTNEAGRDQAASDVKELVGNLKIVTKQQGLLLKEGREFVGDKLGSTTGKLLTAPTQLIEGAIYTFSEKKDVEGGAQLRIKNLLTGEVEVITDPTLARVYAMNGINNSVEDIIDSYFKTTKPTILVERENPTHGPFGDLVESGLGKIFKWIGLPDVVAMNQIAAEDRFARRDVVGGIDIFHSQATIILDGSSQVYADKYSQPVLNYQLPTIGEINTNAPDANKVAGYTNQIDKSQKVFAVGPAMLKEDLRGSVQNNLHIKFDDDQYIHDDKDSVRYLAAPRNVINQVANLFGAKDFNSPIYIPNLIDPLIGLRHIPNLKHHSVTNEIYFAPINKAQGIIQNPSTATPKSLKINEVTL